MLKKVFILAFIALIMAACGNVSQEQSEATAETTEVIVEPGVIAIVDFPTKAESLIGEEVFIEGTVVHVCKHGGKKMFIVGEEDPDIRVKITTTGEEVAAFLPELEGSYVKVKGIVNAIEVEVEEEVEHEEDAEHEGIYHEPQYSVSCIEYVVVETAVAEEEK